MSVVGSSGNSGRGRGRGILHGPSPFFNFFFNLFFLVIFNYVFRVI